MSRTGSIYSIKSKSGLCYIGSTFNLLSNRLVQHISNYKLFLLGKYAMTTSFLVIDAGDFFISLIESVKCDTKEELKARERYFIQILNCVNKNIPLRTSAEYYKDNIEIITAKKSVKIICGCGGKYRVDNKVHHYSTNKHCKWILEEEEYEKNLIKEEVKQELIDLIPVKEFDIVEDYAGNLITIYNKNINYCINCKNILFKDCAKIPFKKVVLNGTDILFNSIF